jgi:uncharacterized protein
VGARTACPLNFGAAIRPAFTPHQTKFNCLYICEIKFSRSEVIVSVIEEVQQKINRLNLSKNFSYRPVLIHVNGANRALVESGYFAKIIDFGQLLSSR